MKKITRIVLGLGIAAIVVVGAISVMEKNKDAREEQAQIEILEAVPVRVSPVSTGQISGRLELIGTVEAHRVVTVSSETNGRILKLNIEEGSYVQAGAPLAVLDTELKKAQLQAAKAQYDKAKRDLERFENLARDNVATGQQLDNARLALESSESQYTVAKRQLEDATIVSPASGVVTKKMVEQGELAGPGTPIAQITDMGALKVRVQVSELDVFQLKQGERVDVTTDVYPGKVFSGIVKYIGVQGDRAHNYPVDVLIPNSAQHPLKAGMFARVTFVQQVKGERVVIPRSALAGSIKKPEVFVIENNQAVRRTLTLGMVLPDTIEVTSGLAKGEQLVVAGQFNLKENTTVTVQVAN